MRILFDTNVLISAALNTKSVPAQAVFQVIDSDDAFVICRQNLEEFQNKIGSKFPKQKDILLIFLRMVETFAEVIEVPEREITLERKIRDCKDRPILRAAIKADIDIIITGDKDFLCSGIKYPSIMTPAEFLDCDPLPPDDPLMVAEDSKKYNRKKKK